MQIEICNFTLIFAIDIISAVLNHFFEIAIFHVNTQLIVFFNKETYKKSSRQVNFRLKIPCRDDYMDLLKNKSFM